MFHDIASSSTTELTVPFGSQLLEEDGGTELLTAKLSGGMRETQLLLKNEKTAGSREAISVALKAAKGRHVQNNDLTNTVLSLPTNSLQSFWGLLLRGSTN